VRGGRTRKTGRHRRMTGPVVSIARCSDYDPRRLRDAVEQALAPLPGIDGLLAAGRRVLLKPNCLSPWDGPEKAVNTHPEFVRAVAEHCVRRGCAVAIGDSCGSLGEGSTRRAMAVSGLPQVAADVGAELINFDRSPSVAAECPDAHILRRPFRVTAAYGEADVVVTLPKFKTHGLTLLTGAIKNQFGMIPGRGKKDVHLLAPKPAAMAQALVDVYSIVKPHLALMDAVVGMEGNGPTAGEPRGVGLLLASRDGVALDSAEGAIMGFEPGQVLVTQYAHERGLGCGELGAVQVVGVPLAQAAVPDFTKPTHRLQGAVMKLVPGGAVRWLFDQVGTARPEVDGQKCILCGECVANCPAGALREEDGRITANHELCISCYCCTEVCRQRAVRMRRSFYGQLLRGVAGAR
jgi:uncharacterized protein (DUF362 family)/Pyruvate/2-oxoacid:ferredoxin oxidoreductase delta subunit